MIVVQLEEEAVEEQAQGTVVAPQQVRIALEPIHAQGSKPSQEAPATLAVGVGVQAGLPYKVSAGFVAALGLTVPRGPSEGWLVRLL